MAKLNKQYEHKGIAYKYVGNRWHFVAPTLELFYPCVGGNSVAKMVAGQMAAALKRTNGSGLDALARGSIKHITGY